jgi:hypothetical protein
MAKRRVLAEACVVLAVVACAALLAACKSPEQIQAEQDEADDARCGRMGVPLMPGDPRYIQCRMWAAQMRLQEEQDRRQAWLAALEAMSAMQQQQQQRQQYLYDEAPVQWITPPQTTWCRPVGRWTSCTSQ